MIYLYNIIITCYIKLEASESASVSADHHDKKSVLGIGCKNPDRSIPTSDVVSGSEVAW